MNFQAIGYYCHPFHPKMMRQRPGDFLQDREAESVLKPRLPDSSLNLCRIYYLSPSEMALTNKFMLFLHIVVCELYVAINITFLVQHEVFTVSSLGAKS